MKKFFIVIKETYTKEICIEAETETEAENILNKEREQGYDYTDATIDYDKVTVDWEFVEGT